MPRLAPRGSYRIGRSRTGLGLFATTPIERGTYIIEYRGRRITNERADRLRSKYLFELDDDYTVDGTHRANTARYVNHSCRPNARAEIVRGKILIRAARSIQPGEEITYHYGKDYFEAFIGKHCRCVRCSERKPARPTRSKRGAAARRQRRG